MTKRQEELVRESFESVRSMEGPLASLFYGRLFSLDPALRPLFHGDMREQGKKLMSTIDSCVESLGRFEELRPQLRELGRRHAGYGAVAAHYPVVEKALLWSLGQALEQQFDAETRGAWAALISEMSAEMMAGAASGTA
jgi:hemoglobin-like flavoprotein